MTFLVHDTIGLKHWSIASEISYQHVRRRHWLDDGAHPRFGLRPHIAEEEEIQLRPRNVYLFFPFVILWFDLLITIFGFHSCIPVLMIINVDCARENPASKVSADGKSALP
jgi:hypothetical protein